jgi:hypothetical protein
MPSQQGCGGNSLYKVTLTVIRTDNGQPVPPSPNSAFVIMSRCSGLALGIPDAPNPNKPTQLQQFPESGGAYQNWRLVPTEGNFFKIQSVGSGLVLDVEHSSGDNQARILQWPDNSGRNQQWEFVPVGEDSAVNEGFLHFLPFPFPKTTFFKIRNRNSRKVVDVPASRSDAGTPIQQYEDHNGFNQHWQLIPVGDLLTQHVYGRNAAGELIHYYWSPQPSWAAENLTQRPTIGAAYRIASDPAVVNLQEGDLPTQHVFGRNAAGELIHYYWSPQPSWAAENLTRYQTIGAAYQIASEPAVVDLVRVLGRFV